MPIFLTRPSINYNRQNALSVPTSPVKGHTFGDSTLGLRPTSKTDGLRGGMFSLRTKETFHNASGPWKQKSAQQRPPLGHRLRGRGGLEYVVKTEYEQNECKQCVFNVMEIASAASGATTLRLAFTRRAFTRGIDFQPYTYDIEISWRLFKKIMDIPSMAKMAFWMKGTSRPSTADDPVYHPSPNIETVLHSRATSAGASSRGEVLENDRLRGAFVKLQRDMGKDPKLDSSKLFSVSSTSGHPLSMSLHRGYFD